MSSLVSIIVPVLRLERGLAERARHLFRPPRNLRNLMDDLERNLTLSYELVVVCNSPQDLELVEFIREHQAIRAGAGGIHKYCINSTNVGVPRAWNMGAMLAEGEFLCFSNDDVELGRGGLETLLDVMRSDSSIAEAGPKGGRWDAAGSGERLGTERVEEADEISGFFFVLRRKVFDEVGGFDVDYTPAWFEEIDMSFRVRQRGYRCVVVPHLSIFHHPHYGVSSNTDAITYFGRTIASRELHQRNKEIFVRKWRGMLDPRGRTDEAAKAGAPQPAVRK